MEWPLSPESNGSAYDEQNYATHPNANAWKRASLPLSNADFKNDMAQGHPGGLLPRAQQRTRKEGPILAELRTNLVIRDERTIITQLTYLLAAQFARRDSSVMIELHHRVCMAMGGKFDPCYRLTILTMPAESKALHSFRNVAFIQSFLANILGVPESRGLVHFQQLQTHDLSVDYTPTSRELDQPPREPMPESGRPKEVPFDTSATKRQPTTVLPPARMPRQPATNGIAAPAFNDPSVKVDRHLDFTHAPPTEAVGLAATSTSNGHAKQPEFGSNGLPLESRQEGNDGNRHTPGTSKQRKSLLKKHMSASTTHLPTTISENGNLQEDNDEDEGNVLHRMKTHFTNRSAISIASVRHEDDTEERNVQAPPIPDEAPSHTRARERRMSRRRSFVEAFRAAAAAT